MNFMDENLKRQVICMLRQLWALYGNACIAGSSAMFMYTQKHKQLVPEHVLSLVEFNDIDMFVPAPACMAFSFMNKPKHLSRLRGELLQEWRGHGLDVTFPTAQAGTYKAQNDDGYPFIFAGIEGTQRTVWNFKLQYKPGTYIPVQVVMVYDPSDPRYFWNNAQRRGLTLQWGPQTVQNFDISICRFWMVYDPFHPDGYFVTGTQAAMAHLTRGTMTFQTTSQVPLCVSLYRIKKYIQRGFALERIRVSNIDYKYRSYFLSSLAHTLGLTANIGWHDLRNGEVNEMVVVTLSYLLDQQQWVEDYVKGAAFYDMQDYSSAVEVTHNLRPWYDKTARQLKATVVP